MGRNKEVDIEMTNRFYDTFSIIHVNGYLDNKALHRTAIPLHFPAAVELERYMISSTKTNYLASPIGFEPIFPAYKAILPGLRILFGSSAFFRVRITLSAT